MSRRSEPCGRRPCVTADIERRRIFQRLVHACALALASDPGRNIPRGDVVYAGVERVLPVRVLAAASLAIQAI